MDLTPEQRQRLSEINCLAEIALNLANYIDREGEKAIWPGISEALHMGYRTMSLYLRRGVKACIDVQDLLSETILGEQMAKSGEKEARKFLTEIFGDESIDCINDRDKARIKEFVKGIEEEWLKEE